MGGRYFRQAVRLPSGAETEADEDPGGPGEAFYEALEGTDPYFWPETLGEPDQEALQENQPRRLPGLV